MSCPSVSINRGKRKAGEISQYSAGALGKRPAGRIGESTFRFGEEGGMGTALGQLARHDAPLPIIIQNDGVRVRWGL